MRFKFSPLESRGVLMGFTLGRLGALVAALLGGVAIIRSDNWPLRIIWIAVTGIFLVIAMARWSGRSLTAWAPVIWAYLAQRGMRQNVYRGGPFARNGVQEHMELPGALAGCVWLPARAPDGQREVGLIHDRHARHVVAVLRCQGTNTILEDSSLQERRVVDWGSVMRSFGDDESLASWSVMERTVPDGANRAQRFIRTRMVRPDTLAATSLKQLVAASAPSTLRHEVYLAVRFDLARLSAQVKEAGGTDAAIAAVVVDALGALEQGVLDAGVGTEGWLSPRGLAAVLRTQFDPGDLTTLEARGVDGEGAAEGVDPRLAGPAATESHWAYFRHDSGWSQTVWVHQLPVREVGRNWLTPVLNQTSCRRSVTLVAQPLSTAKAEAMSRRQMVAHEGDRRTRQKLKLVEGARQRQEARAASREDEEVAAGFTRVRYSMFVTVTAVDVAALEKEMRVVRRKLSQAGCESVVLYGEQDQAFLAGALPLAYGLAPMRGVI
ncbi:SCO6880 family protein [Embleya sp. NPDC056575]|uniref:SCO6880 family protein n=1 Tax=unclassified Embleya TaxID=2699296 RepID=UPI00368E7A42